MLAHEKTVKMHLLNLVFEVVFFKTHRKSRWNIMLANCLAMVLINQHTTNKVNTKNENN